MNSQSSSSSEPPLPQVPFYSVEYPGYIRPTSLPLAINSLGGQPALDHAFRRGTQRPDALLELNLRPGNPFAHPIPGDVVGANNLLLKVVKRKLKAPNGGYVGEYTTQLVGIVAKTARFRSMLDYQCVPDLNDPIAQLRTAMDDMDVDALCSYRVPTEAPSTLRQAGANLDTDVDVFSGLRAFPPPLFSRQAIPQGYNFKANNASMVSTSVDEETGEEKKRMINRMRWKGYGPASIMFTDSKGGTAIHKNSPPHAVEASRSQVSAVMLMRIEELFKVRPIWTRTAIFNQFTASEARDILNSKLLLPLCCYVFQDGPWRDTLVRFSYDPRKLPDSRFYQRLYFRNANHPISRPSITTRRQERATQMEHRGLDKEMERRSHIFDGQTLTKETAAFQLCDIVDPMLKNMIEDPDALREECHERDGWYTTHAFEQIKTVLRHKFFSLLEGQAATDVECRTLIADQGQTAKTSLAQRTAKLRAGKHNMAKGALRPEEAAAVRLRATLDRNAREFSGSQR